jgi:D-glycero-alpha-D-manno-heptose-7-phosphate kinase
MAVATAPVRVCDAGGWTDTWFSEQGVVCNLAVRPGATATARLSAAAGSTAAGPEVDLSVAAFGQRYRYPASLPPGRQPLLEAAIRRFAPADFGRLTVAVGAGVPPGSGVGTSAAVVVALAGALLAVADGGLDPDRVAAAAHQVEVADLGQESGLQDQLAAAHGGASLITIARYPDATWSALTLSPATWEALGRRLLTVFLGRPHRSSDVHLQVIAGLAGRAGGQDRLEPLREAAREAAGALEAGDLEAYGAALDANTEAQAALHPGLVSDGARRVIDVARRHGASGWKVNGAGGDGGTLTVVGPDEPRALAAALADDDWQVLALEPSPSGLRITSR